MSIDPHFLPLGEGIFYKEFKNAFVAWQKEHWKKY